MTLKSTDPARIRPLENLLSLRLLAGPNQFSSPLGRSHLVRRTHPPHPSRQEEDGEGQAPIIKLVESQQTPSVKVTGTGADVMARLEHHRACCWHVTKYFRLRQT